MARLTAKTSASAASTEPQLHPPTTPAQYACVLCKQRKIRCSRQLPCSACIRSGAECVQTSRAPYTSRIRRRRSTGRRLEPAAEKTTPVASANATPSTSKDDRHQDPGAHSGGRIPIFGQNLWTGLPEDFKEPASDESPAVGDPPSSAADTPFADASSLIFGGGSHNSIDLQSVYPPPVHAFELWQAYLTNVNPLSKIMYAPQVQELIVQAAGDFASTPASSLPLLFAIFGTATASLTDSQCQTKFRESRSTLLDKYMAATQKALVAAGFLRTASLVLCQAFAIFLLQARQVYDTNSMWLLTGLGVRMAERLISTTFRPDSGSSECFETQMRRRVWWQIMLIDGRSTQTAGQTMDLAGRTAQPLPANLNDSDISPHMTSLPSCSNDRPTEMIFCLLRYELGKNICVIGPELHDPKTSLARRDQLINELSLVFEEKYLKFADSAIPVHQIAIAGARAGIAKMRLMAHHPGQYPDKGKSLPQQEHNLLFETSVEMVDILVQGLMASHLTHFLWHIDVYFQLDAIVFMLIESQSQPPVGALVDRAWRLVSDVFKYRTELVNSGDELNVAVRKLLARAWETRERKARKLGLPVPLASPVVAGLLAASATQQRPNMTEVTPPPQPAEGAPVATTAATMPSAVPEVNTNQTVLDFTETPVSTADEPPLSMYSDMELLGWDSTEDWESWDYWNNLLHMQ